MSKTPENSRPILTLIWRRSDEFRANLCIRFQPKTVFKREAFEKKEGETQTDTWPSKRQTHLDLPCGEHADPYRQQTSDDAQGDIEKGFIELTNLQILHGFIREGGESGEGT